MATQDTMLISPHDAYRELEDHTVVIIDVRTPGEFAQDHVPGSIHASLATLESDLTHIVAVTKNAKHMLLMCESGTRALRAAKILRDHSPAGQLLHVIDGGMKAWRREKLPVVQPTGERNHRKLSLEDQIRSVAGGIVLCGTAAGFFLHPAFLLIPAFAGTGLIVAGITGFCPMGLMLARMPWNR